MRMISTEKLLGPVDCELLDLVDKLAATIVPLSRKTFGVLGGEVRAHAFEQGFGNEVLARNELDAVALTIAFATNHRRYIRIVIRQHRHLRSLDSLDVAHSHPDNIACYAFGFHFFFTDLSLRSANLSAAQEEGMPSAFAISNTPRTVS